MTPDLSIYLVTDTDQATRAGHTITDVVLEAVAGGVTAVQIREKNGNTRDMLDLVETLARHLPDHVALFVNDRIDVFLAARARGARLTGVHIGQRDLSPQDVRALIGDEPLIGLSANTPTDLAAAAANPARIAYVGIGAVHGTTSKPDAPPPLGVDGVTRLAAASPLPALAIGGITPDDLPALRKGGLAGVAVVSWVCAAPDPRAAAAELVRAWECTS